MFPRVAPPVEVLDIPHLQMSAHESRMGRVNPMKRIQI